MLLGKKTKGFISSSLIPSSLWLSYSHTHTHVHTLNWGRCLLLEKCNYECFHRRCDGSCDDSGVFLGRPNAPLALPNQRYLSHLLWRAIKSLKHRPNWTRPRRGIKGSVGLIHAGEDFRCHLGSLTYHWLFKSYLKAAKWAGQTGSTATPERASVSFNT